MPRTLMCDHKMDIVSRISRSLYGFKVAEHSFCARFADSVSDAIKRALGLWYANTAVDKVIPQFHMNWIIKLSFDLK